jgi:hypothetical protein
MTAPKITPDRIAHMRENAKAGNDLTPWDTCAILDALEAAELERDEYRAALEKLGILSEDCNCSCCKYDAKAVRDALAKHSG